MGMNVAITGLQATDNPAPGIGVIRCLKHPNGWDGKIIGLAYDVYDTGIYDTGLLDHTFLIPYPNQGSKQVLERLLYIHSQVNIDVIIPNLDSEFPLYQKIEEELNEHGIKLFIPSKEAVDSRTKANLTTFCDGADILTPKTVVVRETGQFSAAVEEIGFPVMVKGVFYDAEKCRTISEAENAFQKMRVKWGMPIIVQEVIDGEEYDICCVAGKESELLGAVAIRKTGITDKGKAWAAVTINNDELLQLSKKVLKKINWFGPCELEFLQEKRTKKLFMLEINPRFPAWIYVCTGADQNLPKLVVELASGKNVESLPPAKSGVIFVRHATDLVCSLDYLEHLTVSGELHY